MNSVPLLARYPTGCVWLAVAAFVFGVGCGRSVPSLQVLPTASPSPTETSSPLPTAPPTEGPWQTYTDKDYGFSIDYPPSFVVEFFDTTGRQGWLKEMRFVDKEFFGTEEYPAGQVELGVYLKDADTLNEWVSKHSTASDVAFQTDRSTYYFFDVRNVSHVTAVGRSAVSFDSPPHGDAPALHALAFFSGSFVFRIDWFAEESSYATTIRPIFERMLASYRD